MISGRNGPCPCGSGKKHKRCCGAVIAIKPSPARAPRDCGTCTACCDGWLKGSIEGHAMSPGTPCHFVRPGGCSIYDRRPQAPCRDFICGWVAPNSPFPESFRPDRAGVIILPFKWQGQPAMHIVSAGRDPDAALLQWMMRYCERSGAPLFYEERGETVAFGSLEFQKEVQRRLKAGEAIL